MTITPDSQSQEECLDTGDCETVFPTYGSYVTIKLDPVGSVAFTENEEAATAAEKLPGKTYVGFVGGSQDPLYIKTPPILSFEVRMLRAGLSPARPEQFFTSDMCIPVFPNTDHPSRAPVQPIPAIPWENAYHASSEKVILRVRSALADKRLATVLSKSERLRLAFECDSDEFLRFDSICAASADNGPTYTAPVPSGAQLDSIYEAPADNGPTYTASVSSRADEDSEEWEVPQGPPDTTPWVHMSYDLTSVQELCDPQYFFQEIEVVQQLIRGAQERKAQKKAQDIENARKIDEAAFGLPPSRPSSMTPTPLPEPAATTEAAPITSTDPYRAVRHLPFVVALNRWAARIGQAISRR